MKTGSKWKNRVMAALSAGVLAVTGTMSAATGFTASAEDLGLDNYAKLLQYSLYFFDANMCGSEVGETSAFSWRDDCHTGDVVEGGFHDAGDGIKCGLTAGFTASTLGWMYYEYEEQFQKTGTTEHYQVVMDYFCDFFKKSTTLSNGEVTSFVYEIGNDGTDHSTWCAPETMWDHGSSETYSTTNGASNVAAQYAAALAQNYMISGNEEDLTYATALYNFAAKYRTMTYEESTYSDKDVQDDISWAAGWMYLATGEDAYLTENSKYTSSTNDWTNDYCYANAWLGAAIINAEITGNWSNAVNYIDTKVNANQNQFYVMNSWGSARHNTLMQLCALVCTKYSAESGKDYSEWCKQQMNYILGENNANVCLVVGYNSLSATSPHHRAASNLTVSSDWHEWNSWDGNYASTGGHTLYGALVGGPTSSDFTTYNPSAQDATSNEVALDYQVGLVGAAAGLFAVYGTGEVVAEIGDEVTVYPSEVAVANGEQPVIPGTTTTEETTTTTTEETTTTTEEVTTEDIIVDPADYLSGPSELALGDTASVNLETVFYTSVYEWVSSDSSVIEIVSSDSQTASIKAQGVGTAVITAKTSLGDRTLEISVYDNGSTTTDQTTETMETTETTETTTTSVMDSSETTESVTSETTAETTGNSGNSILYGDVNLDGRIDITDAVLLNKKVSGAVTLNDAAMKNADCNVDNEVNGDDAILLLKFLVHIVTSIGSGAE